MIPYAKHEVTPEDEAAVLRALRSQRLTQGPEVEAFEAELCAATDARYAVCVANGTLALELAYQALGVGPELGIACPTVTFMATANAARRLEAVVAFTDPAGTWMDPTRCVVDVSLGGDHTTTPSADGRITKGRVHDASHTLGAGHLLDGYHCTTLSFHAIKQVACGEGGAILTNDPTLYQSLWALRDHGCRFSPTGSRSMTSLGTNARMAEMPAALGRSQLRRLPENLARRRHIASVYNSVFGALAVPHGPDSARHLYQIRVPAEIRDRFRGRLAELGVGTQVHYPPVHLQPYYRTLGWKEGDFPQAEQYAAEVMSLPLFPSLTEQEIETVIQSVVMVTKELMG